MPSSYAHFIRYTQAARAFRDERDPLGFRPLTAAPPAPSAHHTQPPPLVCGDASGGAVATGRAAAERPQPQQQQQPRLRQFLEGGSTYVEDFTLRPLDRNSLACAGTVRQTKQVAGYTGFIPASKANARALRQAFEPSAERGEQAEGVRLVTLDQYSRLRPGGYTGYKPQAPVNALVFDPHQANMATVTGRAEYFGTVFKGQPAKSVGPNAGLPKQSMLSFFTAGQSAVSDNGITEAQRYYCGVRPNEGMPAMFRPPGTTAYGKQFATQGITTFQ